MKKNKRIIFVDLDGVLNTYDGEYNENFIPPMKNGADKFLKKLSRNFCIKIFTTRNTLQTSKWIIENKLDKYVSDVTNFKSAAYLTIDDRCLNFRGNFEKTLSDIESFTVWYKQ